MHNPYGEAYPQAIARAVKRAARLGKPIYIMENGVPDATDRIRPWLIANALRGCMVSSNRATIFAAICTGP